MSPDMDGFQSKWRTMKPKPSKWRGQLGGVLLVGGAGVGAIVLIFALSMGMRWFSNVTVSVETRPVGDHTCAVATTADGVAIDCWPTP